MNKVEQYKLAIDLAIKCAETNNTKLTQTEFDHNGMSSRKVRIFLNELVASPLVLPVKYLEVGVWHGSTFISALYKNIFQEAHAIDNFSQFNANYDVFVGNCLKSNVGNFLLHKADSFALNEEQKQSIKDVNIYFYDGGHTREDQRKAITEYIDHLSDLFILIVDDWDWIDVQAGTYDGLLEFNSTNNGRKFRLQTHRTWHLPSGEIEGYWNGLLVAICEKIYE